MSTPARPATRPGFAETLTALERAQKPGHGVPAGLIAALLVTLQPRPSQWVLRRTA